MGWIVLPGVEVTQKLTRVLSVVVDRRAAARPSRESFARVQSFLCRCTQFIVW